VRREAQARGEPVPQRAPQAAAARVPEPVVQGRKMDVAPDLVTQSPPPPRSPAQQEAAQAASGALAGAYTQASRYGDLVFVSGQIALDSGNQLHGATIGEQTRQVMENIRAILESHRLSMANVVSTTVYLKDMNDFRGMNDTYETYFKVALPARSVVEVARLPRGALVEISAVAGR
jgi:2-iminobutanoate/2-iminopropanoate deaminase